MNRNRATLISNLYVVSKALSSRIQSAKTPNVQIIGEMDALLSLHSESFVWALVALCPYLYLCPYLPGFTLQRSCLT